MVKEDAAGFEIYIKNGVPLQKSDARADKELNVGIKKKNTGEKNQNQQENDSEREIKIRDFMCKTFYDVRTFGAVMTTFVKRNLNSGQVRGPVQLTFSRSVDPILPQEITLTRVAITTEEDAEKKNTEIGRKYIVPYGLYRCEGFISANLARKTTGFSEDDLELLWQAIENMFENDHSAARGKMAVRALLIFKHDSELGNAPAHKLFEAVTVKKKPGVESPHSFNDYDPITINKQMIPKGVELIKRVWPYEQQRPEVANPSLKG